MNKIDNQTIFRKNPRLCLIGTSNAVMRGGYSYSLQQNAYYGCVDNYSIGFCSSDLFAFLTDSIDFSKYDICILDFCCNDATLLGDGFIDEKHIKNSLRHAVSVVSGTGCIPMFLLLPIELEMPGGGEIVAIYSAIAVEMGVLFFDGYGLLRKLNESYRVPVDRFWKNYMHINIDIAAVLSDALTSAFKSIGNESNYFESDECTCARGGLLRSAELFGSQVRFVERATSLLAVRAAELFEGKGIDVCIADGFRVIAICADFAHCNGGLSFSGDTNVRLQMAGDLFVGNEKSLSFGIFPVRGGVGPSNGTVRLNVFGDRPSDLIFNSNYREYIEEGSRISIVGLIVHGADEAMSYLRYSNKHLDLLAYAEESEVEQAVQSRLLNGGHIVT